MIHIRDLESSLNIFKALGSEIRIKIIKLLLQHKNLNLNDIATKLNLANSVITMHIKKLEDCGLVSIFTTAGKNGLQKICCLSDTKIMVDFIQESMGDFYEVDIKVGHYTAYEAKPTCGLATKDKIIGEFDDPRFFTDPERMNAEILWLTEGFVEYWIPNYLKSNQYFEEIQFIAELASEAPRYNNNWPSDIYFYLNGIELGFWTSPGDFGGVKGALNPDWWLPQLNQYGVLKLIRINKEGTFIDGGKISDITINDIGLTYKSDIKLKISAPVKAANSNGLTIFGAKFGNYHQDITARVLYANHALI
jgi:predicted transcriptional regulator